MTLGKQPIHWAINLWRAFPFRCTTGTDQTVLRRETTHDNDHLRRRPHRPADRRPYNEFMSEGGKFYEANLDPMLVGLDRPPCQRSYRTGGFVLIEKLHAPNCAAQELLGQFARPNSPYVAEKLKVRSFTSPCRPCIIYAFLLDNHKFGTCFTLRRGGYLWSVVWHSWWRV